MPTYELVASEIGSSYGAGPDYTPCPGVLADNGVSTEAQAQILARSTISLKNLFFRVTASTAGTQTVRLRKNGVNGNLVASAAFPATGAFEDTTNTDSLVTGDLFCLELSGAGGGIRTVSMVGLTLNDTTGNNTLIASTNLLGGETFGPADLGVTTYAAVLGRCLSNVTEASTRYTVRNAGTYSNLRVFVSANSAVGSSTVRFRKNTANGNQSFSIAGGATGSFEDTTNSDTVVSGDIINYQVVVPDLFLRMRVMQSKVVTTNQIMAAMGGAIGVSADNYVPANGNAGVNVSTTEAFTQKTARSAFTASKMYVNVTSHGLTSGVNIYFRLNGVNSALTVSIPQSTTGIFEDTTNNVSVVSGDLYNFFIDHGGGAGSISLIAIGFGDGPTDVIAGAGVGGYPTHMHNRRHHAKHAGRLGQGLRVP